MGRSRSSEHASARLEQKPLSLPDSALAQAACDGSELTVIDVVEHDNVGRRRDCFVCLIFIPDLDIQAKSKATHFACAQSPR